MDSPGTRHSEPASVLLLCDDADVVAMVNSSIGHLCTITSQPLPAAKILILYTCDNMLPDLLFIANHCRRHPNLCPILISTRPFDHLFETLSHHGIFHVLNVGAPSFREALHTAVGGALNQVNIFDLPPQPGLSCRETQFEVLTRKEYDPVLSALETFFQKEDLPPERLWEMRLLLDEAFNNALFHSFQDEDGMEKYSHEAFTGLYDHDLITIKLAAQDGVRSAMVITDSAGTLDPYRVLAALNRQISRHGIFDRRGRGLYLMRRLSDRMIINIQPGRLTQIQLYFNHKISPAWKNLEINVLKNQ